MVLAEIERTDCQRWGLPPCPTEDLRYLAVGNDMQHGERSRRVLRILYKNVVSIDIPLQFQKRLHHEIVY